MFKKAITALLFLSLTCGVAAQTSIDSLQTVVESSTNDSIKASALLSLSQLQSDPELAIEYGTEALTVAETNELVELTAEIATSLGIVYYGLGDYEKTLDFFYQAQTANETLQDSMRMAIGYNNIGLILSDLGRLDETVKNHKLSLRIKQSLGDDEGIANSLSNLGLAYQEMDSLDLALDYFYQALKIDQSLNNTYGLYTIFSNLGKNYFLRDQFDSTSFYYNKAIMLTDQINNSYNKAELLKDYADLNAKQGQYGRAIEKYNSSLRLAQDIDAKSIIRDNYKGLSFVYQQINELDEALVNYEKYDSLNKLLFSQEQSNKLAEIERNYQIQRGQKEIELLKKESEIKDLQLRNNTYTMYFLVAGILMVAAIVMLQYRKNLYKTKTNRILRNQNIEIQDKNKNIMDSILYAKNIQKAILPSGDKLKALFKDAFVYSKARDIVNGDFYWFAEKGDKVIIAAVDCTGHGVPAAFLNVLGNSHLNSIVIEQNQLAPGEVLKKLNERMLTSLHGNELDLHTEDGMDIGLCLLDTSSYKLQFAGAKRPLYYFHENELRIIKGDSHPVGGDAYQRDRSFQQHDLQLKKDDSFYLFSDGIVDQFGGPKNKKFMYSKLRSILQRVHDQPMADQLMVIQDDFFTWKGDNQQTDDILIIGIRV